MKLFLIIAMLFSLSGCFSNTVKTVIIQPNGNQMEYMTQAFTVKPSETIRLIMDNTATIEVMKHNIVILNDASKVNEIGILALSAPNYLPDHPAIIAATPLANIGSQTEVTFTAPNKPGQYTYICTYPGHYTLMKGIMIVK